VRELVRPQLMQCYCTVKH